MSSKEEVDWAELSEKLHRKYRGKIEVTYKVPITDINDFSIWYTPGVAEPCKRIQKEGKELSFEYSLRWNYAAVISDGTRVLGLGNIGPEAGLPVVEGKALLFKYLGGVDAVPLVINVHDPEEFIRIVKAVEPSFGAINLEDIESPKCFYVLEKLQEILNIPVWHDDQQGTALVNIAALINALRIVGKSFKETKVILFGAGAANIALYKYLKIAGVDPKNITLIDSKGIIYPEREDMSEMIKENIWKYKIAQETHPTACNDIRKVFEGADIVIAASRPGPGIIKKEWISKMNKDAIVFAEANPVPEIWPWEAKEAGARIVATGRSDFPNQVNNSLGFPAVFRGVLTVCAKKMADEMFMAAAEALAKYAENKGINEEYILPRINEIEAYVEAAIAVAKKAKELGLARRSITNNELEIEIKELIYRSRKLMKILLDTEIIKKYY
jgi:malate dehydrogenase (oxaloacetate-decarboxylating)